MQRSLSSTRALSVASDDAGETTRELPRVHPATRAKRWTIKLKRKGDKAARAHRADDDDDDDDDEAPAARLAIATATASDSDASSSD